MPDFTGGYTGALNSENLRRRNDVAMQRMLQQITLSQIEQRRQEEDRRRAIAGETKGVETLTSLEPPPPGAPPATPSTPPLGAPTMGQPSASAAPSPAPGAPSVPGAPPAGAAPAVAPPGAG